MLNDFMIEFYPKIANDEYLDNVDEMKFIGIDPIKIPRLILILKNMCQWLYLFKFTSGVLSINNFF